MASVQGQRASGAQKSLKNSNEANRASVTYDNNHLVAMLLGEFDTHLTILEEKLGIEAFAKGNVITFKGSPESCDIAKSVLDGLYERLSNGDHIGPGDIEGAIRHNHATAEDAVKKPNGEGDNSAQAQIRTRKRVITGRTPMQSKYIRALHNEDLVFATGPAGTGKTYLAVAYAASCWERGETERIILSRPAVEAGERLGFLPGDMRDKVDPYLRPLYDALYDVLPPERVEKGLESGAIEIAPLAFMRGRTLSNAFVILDEAQNCTAMQMKMFLTRLGEKSKMVVTGDPTQIDLPKGMMSGLTDAIGILGDIEGIGHIVFAKADVVRRELVAKIVEAYDKGH